MKLDGSAVLHGTPEQVWSVITDPAVLARTIPGCESLRLTGPDEYEMNVSVGVGAIRGTYAGAVRLTDQQRPTSYVMHASGAGAPGNARAKVLISLAADGDGATTLTYSADAVVGGPVAGVGQRMITGVAKRMAGQFFSAIDGELTSPVTVPAVEEPRASSAAVSSTTAPAAEGVTAGTCAAPAPQVFTGGKAAASAGAQVDLRSFMLGVASGGILTAWGVALGYLLGRRRSG
ncbi:carbon monoxide dehydrogenase subunit G [Blastococcus sp. TF02A-26]|uniref:SRPBCC family protein n=1 Tax=Blastococcus sp. TF02A-26 TaxID=2250577 RepID=UPI000DE899A3|nr:carbon monoxide dehydrogenase subunit G [Blastococcus sp. TF02A-26]RBY88779.1 carbon monoxide dehydrogenase [Blastococcus sp. TF02A-26]